MRYRDEEDRGSGGFELAGFVCAAIASAVAFIYVSGSTPEPAAQVRFMDGVRTGPAVSSETTSGIAADTAALTLPASAPEPTSRP
jgi:hypothetical protein